MQETAAVLTHGWFSTVNAKTAHGLVRGPSRYKILGLVDHECAGKDAGAELDGAHRGIPCFATLAELITAVGKPDVCVVGIATPGGVLPPEFRALLLDALKRGIGLVNGLHTFLGDDPEFAATAAANGVRIVDIRRPKKRAELSFWSGAIRGVAAPRIAVLGTDCALGKRTTAQTLVAACRAAGMRAEMVHTGQTGWLQGAKHGFILDSTVNDFVSGELERAVVACDREEHPDVIFLEGQSALRNPSGPCGAELLLSAESHGVILQHAPARPFFEEQEELGNRIPSLRTELELVALYGARVLAITVNHEHLAPEAREAARQHLERETGAPAIYPLLGEIDRLVPLVRAYVHDEHAARSAS
jgi:uncharacterized NAD-dependent epimerase/dehydratase family protein